MDDIIKLNSMESSSMLFEKAIPVKLTKLPGSEDRLMELTVRIVMGISKLHRPSKLLRMQLTNEADPFFLYFLEVSEEDFQSLKVEQCILVDFTTFPHKLIELLEHCIDAGSHDTPSLMEERLQVIDSAHRFQAVLHLRTGDSTFSIVEANQFKHLSHLSLCFRQGNDSTIKIYLAGRLAEFKTANTDLHEKLRRTLLSLEMALRDNGNLSSELADLRENNSRTMNQLKTEYAMEIAHEKEKATRDFFEAKERFEKEQAELENRLRQQAEVHQYQLLELEKQVRELVDSKHTLEVKVAAIGTRLETAEKDLDDKIQECEGLRAEKNKLDAEKGESLKMLNKHLVRLAALDQEVQDKSELITGLQKQLEIQTSQRASIELHLREAQTVAEHAEEKYSTSDAELNKCRQSIEKLQAELRTCKAKVKLKGQVASQQDNLLLERQTAIDRTLQENNTLKQDIAALRDDNDSLKKKVEELKGKLDDSQELQQSNQQMIQWLNQQLTDAQLGKLGSTHASSRYMLRPSLSFLSTSDSANLRVLNHAGAPFSGSGSLNGTLSCTTYKSMLRSISPFGQSIHSKTLGTSASDGKIPALTSASTMRSATNKTQPLHSGQDALKAYKPPVHLLPKAELTGGTSASTKSIKVASCPEKLDSMTKITDPVLSIGKKEEHSWTLLPRPPLSFVDARNELLSLTPKTQIPSTATKAQNNSINRTSSNNEDDAAAAKPLAHSGDFSSASSSLA